ncbi:MAG: transglutaminase family protein [Myxococcales bacterium]|nr:transglutaminase family protein [Myxococcales bacterium]
MLPSRLLPALLVAAALGACRRPAAPRPPTPAAPIEPARETCDPAPRCPDEAATPVSLAGEPAYERIRAIVGHAPADIDLGEVSAWMSYARDPTVDVPAVLRRLDAMAAEVRSTLPRTCDARCRLRGLVRHVFRVWRFEAVSDPNGLYNDPDRDLIDTVIEQRRGYCEGLSVLLLALGRRLDVPLAGVLRRQHIYVRYMGDGPRWDVDLTREGAPPLPDPVLPLCRPREGLYERPLDARELVGQVVSVVGILDGLHARRAWLDAAMTWAPTDPDLRNNRGVERERDLDLAGALDDYRAAAALDPCAAFYRVNIAGALRRMGRAAEAEQTIAALEQDIARRAAEDDPLYVSLAHGDLALERGDDMAAERWYLRASVASEGAPVARESFGIARLVQGDAAGAAEEFLAALEQGPDPDVRIWLVEALSASGLADPRVELDRAERDGAAQEDVLLWRAVLAERDGRVDEAMTAARACLQSEGSRCARALVVLGDLARRRGDRACARRYYETFLTCGPPARDRYARWIDGAVTGRIAAMAREPLSPQRDADTLRPDGGTR